MVATKYKEYNQAYQKRPEVIARRKELLMKKGKQKTIIKKKEKELVCPNCKELYLKENRADKKCLFCNKEK